MDRNPQWAYLKNGEKCETCGSTEWVRRFGYGLRYWGWSWPEGTFCRKCCKHMKEDIRKRDGD